MSSRPSMVAKLLRAGGLREFARLAAEATAVGVFASIALLLAALFIASAEAATPVHPAGGALLFRHGDVTIPATPLRYAVIARGE